MRKNNANAQCAGYNKNYILSFYSTHSGRIPASTIVDSSYWLAAKPEFDANEYCANLRTKYITWDKYVDSIMIKNLRSGNQASMGGRELANSRWLASQQVTHLNGTTNALFPVGYYSVNPDSLNIVNSSFEWHLPSVPEAAETFSGVGILPDGIVNATLSKMGGTAWIWTNGQYYWLSSRINAVCCWILNESGRAGLIDWYNFGATCRYLSIADI
jgi:hypothetical protein